MAETRTSGATTGTTDTTDAAVEQTHQGRTASKRSRIADDPTSDGSMTVIRYLEFFAGIGGWTMALQKAVTASGRVDTVRLERCAALDHSDLCLSVFHHNHSPTVAAEGAKATRSKAHHHKLLRIEHLTSQQLVDWNADVWMMSPPCQPHTRQHDNQEADLEDSRSDSFLHVCHLLDQLEDASKPSLILLENVVGFESSKSCQTWETIVQRSYTVARFHVQPTQVGLPNDRPRYYSVAVRRDTYLDRTAWLVDYFDPPLDTDLHSVPRTGGPRIHTALPELGVTPPDAIHDECIEPMKHFLSSDDTMVSSLLVPNAFLERPASWCFDIVTPESKRSSCFTAAYGKYIKGTGSVLLVHPISPLSTHRHDSVPDSFAMVPPEERQFEPEWHQRLLASGCTLRYFSGLELTRLFGFVDTFSFPSHVTVKQQWKLVGNSLNVRVASKLVELGLLAMGASPTIPKRASDPR